MNSEEKWCIREEECRDSIGGMIADYNDTHIADCVPYTGGGGGLFQPCNARGECNNPTEKCVQMQYMSAVRTNTLLYDSNICLDLNNSMCEYANGLGIYQDSIYYGNDFNEGSIRQINCTPFIGSELINSPCIYNSTDPESEQNAVACAAENATCIEVIVYNAGDFKNDYFENYENKYASCKTLETKKDSLSNETYADYCSRK